MTQAKAPAGALQVEVIGHQWWWEFRYPEYGITTANELYLPVGRAGQLQARDEGRPALVLDSAARWQARPDLEQDELSLDDAA